MGMQVSLGVDSDVQQEGYTVTSGNIWVRYFENLQGRKSEMQSRGILRRQIMP